MRPFGVEAEEIFFEDKPAVPRDKQRLDQTRVRRRRVRLRDRAHESRERALVDADLAGAVDLPPVRPFLRRVIRVSGCVRGPRKESESVAARSPRQLDRLTETRPIDPDLLGRGQQHRIDTAFSIAALGEEMKRVPSLAEAELSGAAVEIRFRVPESSLQCAVRPAKYVEIEGEALIERSNGGAPRVCAGGYEGKRRRHGLELRRRGLNPETGKRPSIRFQLAAKRSAAGESNSDFAISNAAALFNSRDARIPYCAPALDRQRTRKAG